MPPDARDGGTFMSRMLLLIFFSFFFLGAFSLLGFLYGLGLGSLGMKGSAVPERVLLLIVASVDIEASCTRSVRVCRLSPSLIVDIGEGGREGEDGCGFGFLSASCIGGVGDVGARGDIDGEVVLIALVPCVITDVVAYRRVLRERNRSMEGEFHFLS